MNLEQRIIRLEKKVSNHRRLLVTVYNRFYARFKRRSEHEREKIASLKKWEKSAGLALHQRMHLGWMVKKAKQGLYPVYLSKSDGDAFRQWARGRVEKKKKKTDDNTAHLIAWKPVAIEPMPTENAKEVMPNEKI